MTAIPNTSRLMVLMFTDIVGSVELKGRLGAAAYAEVIARHDRLFREGIDRCKGARVIQDTGDGFLAQFETASDAVVTALRFQETLRRAEWEGAPMSVRVGLNLGQVTVVRDQTGGTKYVGLATDITARVMGLAQGGQILMTRSIFDDARQYVREHPHGESEDGPALQWMAHGQYLFKGSDDPIDVYEVGAANFAPLRAPPDSDKARRAVNAMEEETLGWRPAAGLEVPRRRGWVLTQKLGEGGFGEVWLGKHNRTKDNRVFKFCFDAERLRSFKRELMLFRLLRDALGDRKDIAKLFEVQLEESPYFLESEYSGYGSLSEWTEKQGGLDKVPPDLRIDMVARTAEAVAAAHSIGVIHKDIKPSNILMYMSEDGVPRPRLADFGIGVVTDRSQFEKRNITVTGMTEGWLEGNESSRTGTRMYAPPESLAGQAFTVQGDIYALGVFLYQMVVGDFNKPLATGWESDVSDELLRVDIQACTMGDRERRLGSAKELSDRLRALPERRRALAAARRRRVLLTGGGVAAVVALVAGVWGTREFMMRQRAERAEKEAIEQRDKATQLTKSQREVATEFVFQIDDKIKAIEGATTARTMALSTGSELLKKLGQLDPEDTGLQLEVAKGMTRLGDIQGGLRSANVGSDEAARRSYSEAVEICEGLVKKEPENGLARYALATARFKLADLVRAGGDSQKALAMFMSVLDDAEKAAVLQWGKDADPRVCGRLAASAELKISDVHRQVKNAALARDYMERSLTRRRAAMEKDPEDEQAIRDMAIGLGRKGKVLEEDKDFAGSVLAWQESVALREKLALKPSNVDSMRAKRDLAQGLTDLGTALNVAGKTEEAIANGRRTVAILKELIAADPIDNRLKLTLMDAQLSLGGTLRTADHHSEAATVFEENIALAEEYLRGDAQSQTALYVLIQTLCKLGETRVELKQPAEAKAALEHSLKMVETLLVIDPTNAKVDRWRKAATRELAELNGEVTPPDRTEESPGSPTG